MIAIGKINIIYDVVITMFNLEVLHNGDFNTVHGSILYDEDELRIDNPYTRSRLTCRFSEYDKVDGNLQEFVVKKCRGMLRDKGMDTHE